MKPKYIISYVQSNEWKGYTILTKLGHQSWLSKDGWTSNIIHAETYDDINFAHSGAYRINGITAGTLPGGTTYYYLIQEAP